MRLLNSRRIFAVLRYGFIDRGENRNVSFDLWKSPYDGQVTYNIAYATGLEVTEYGVASVKVDIETDWASKCDAHGILITRVRTQ